MSQINQSNIPDETNLDSLIDRTLSGDAEYIRAKFATVPDSKLTAKLAMQTASHGMVKALGAKLLLYSAGAIILFIAIYFSPSFFQKPGTKSPGNPLPPAQNNSPISQPVTPLNVSSPSLTIPKAEPVYSASKVTKANPSKAKPIDTSKAKIQLVEGDDKNIRKITEQNYQPPLK